MGHHSESMILKLKQNRIPLLILALFLLGGFLYFKFTESQANIGAVLLMMIGAETPSQSTTFSKVYNIIWTVVIAQAILGFIIASFLQDFNPVATARLYASHQKKHTLVIGYAHIGIRIAEYLHKKKKPFVVLENNLKIVDDLIQNEEAVVLGDEIDDSNLRAAGISSCKEAFILLENPRHALICAEKIRAVNKNAKLYLKLYPVEYDNYLKGAPFNAFTFSNSKWAMSTVNEWTQNDTGKSILLGSNHLAKRICDYLLNIQHRFVYWIDQNSDSVLFQNNPNIKRIMEDVDRVENLEKFINFNEITQVFVCWNEGETNADIMNMSMEIKRRFPQIKVYVRIFEDELAPILERVGILPFSTTRKAFKMLQKEVSPDSAIYEK